MIKNKRICFEQAFDQQFADKILVTLYTHDELSLMNLAEYMDINLHNNDVKRKWNKLRMHLLQLEEDGYIEERHFEEGIVDCSLETNGIEEALKLLKK